MREHRGYKKSMSHSKKKKKNLRNVKQLMYKKKSK